MKNVLIRCVFIILFYSCATTYNMTTEAFNHALIGHSEDTIYSRLGIPSEIISTLEGGKIMVYEYYSKGMYTNPYKSRITFNPNLDMSGQREGFVFKSRSIATNKPEYTIYDIETSYLKLFLDKHDYCVRYEQNLTPEQLEIYYEIFKRYVPEK